MLDADKVRKFWNERALSYKRVAFESVANLEQDHALLQIKVDDETRKVSEWLGPIDGLQVLDLGAGVGQWSFRLAQWGAARVVAVEYAAPLVELGRAEAQRRGLEQVSFVESAAEDFSTEETFDLLFVSGLFVYLNDDQAEALLSRLAGFVRPGGRLLLRDGTALGSRYEINDRYSAHLGVNYSATYRTRADYLTRLCNAGFEPVRDEQMFPEGHPLNKYPETRLWLYLLRRPFA